MDVKKAIKTIKEYCIGIDSNCRICEIQNFCYHNQMTLDVTPDEWVEED